jgi:hypothetical protein
LAICDEKDMFVLKSLGKMILGDSGQKELIKLPFGTLWKVELDSKDKTKIVKRSQCFNDEEGTATLILRRGSETFSYELIVSVVDSASFENEAGPFKLRADLSFTLRKDNNLFYWNEPDGPESNVVWEFVMNEKETSPTTIEMFQMTVPSFTPARFSTGQSEERAIITSSGPYVITWNLRRVKQGHLNDYQIKKYDDVVVADNFRYGQDRSIVVTLPESVTMISKKSLSCPSPKSLRSQIVDEY